MAVKFIGAQVRAGEFTDEKTGQLVQYNNLVLYTTQPLKCGEMWSGKEPIKISNTAENIAKVFGRAITMPFLKERLGWYVDIFYNKYKKVERVIFYEKDPALDESAYDTALTVGYKGLEEETTTAPAGITDADYEY